MKFAPRVILRARGRQDRKDGMGFLCARCGETLNPFFRWYAIPRIPKSKGGNRKIENCVILCPKCYLEIGQDNTKEIPYRELPYFEV